jgi:hypothetical protein
MIRKFVSKPISLVQFTGDNIDEIQDFIGDTFEIIDTRKETETEEYRQNFVTVWIKGLDKTDSFNQGYYSWLLFEGEFIRPTKDSNCVGFKVVQTITKQDIESKYDEIKEI